MQTLPRSIAEAQGLVSSLLHPNRRGQLLVSLGLLFLLATYMNLQSGVSSGSQSGAGDSFDQSLGKAPRAEDDPNYRRVQFFELLKAAEKEAIQQHFRERVQGLYEPPVSCVFNCSTIPKFSFRLSKGIQCQPRTLCTFTALRSFHYNPDEYIRFHKRSKVACREGGTLAICNFPRKNDCDEHGWREWILRYRQNDQANYTTRFFTAQYLPGRPFMINNIFETNEYPSHWKVVSFFQPAGLSPNRCNQMYCFYEYADGLIERHEAKPGDMSFVYCPKPRRTLEDISDSIQSNRSRALMRLSYDHKVFSHPFGVTVDRTMEKHLPKVFLSLCTIVKREGKNLKEWIAFHFMMGYDRIILYDNNEPGDVDQEMEKYIRAHPNRIIRYRWPFLHAQTEQSTDCVLRFGSTTTWMTFIDVDEFLVPSPPHENIRSLLTTKYKNDIILQATWIVFGPCGTEKRGEGTLTMERCKNVYPYPFPLHKTTFQPAYIAGMQAIGPHFPRLKTDIGTRLRSLYRLVNEDMRTYHYRFRTLPEFIERRMGSAADRIIVQDLDSLMKDWKNGVRLSHNFSDSENHMLRFIPKLKREMDKYHV